MCNVLPGAHRVEVIVVGVEFREGVVEVEFTVSTEQLVVGVDMLASNITAVSLVPCKQEAIWAGIFPGASKCCFNFLVAAALTSLLALLVDVLFFFDLLKMMSSET